MDISQYMEVFIDEGREHLQTMNQKLIELEKEPENRSILDSLFRVAHTLKGMTATMGFQDVSSYTHKMENVLDVLRQGKATATSEIIDLLLEGADALEEFVESIAEGEESKQDFPALQKKLEESSKMIMEKSEDSSEAEQVTSASSNGTDSSTGHKEQKESGSDALKEAKNHEEVEGEENDKETVKDAKEENLASKLSMNQHEKKMVLEAEKSGYNALYVDVTLDESTLLKGARAFMVFQKVEEFGEIIKSEPDVESIEDERFDREFYVVMVTSEDMQKIKDSIESISEIENVIISRVRVSEDEEVKSETAEEVSEKEGVKEESGPEERQVAVAGEKDEKDSGQDKGAKEKDKEEAGGSQKVKTGKTVRVDIERLDKLMNLVSELVINKTRLEQIAVTEEVQGLLKTSEQFSRITSEIQNVVMNVRMVPLEQVFSRFPRMVRDLSRSLEKEVDFTIEGEETELDRSLIDEIGDPLMHLIRNSIDHGIEDANTREKVGKPSKGKVNLKAYHNENNVVIEVEDDGRGMDAGAIRSKALKKGLIDENQSEKLSDSDVLDLLFEPGFSTSDEVSDVSGRGVGLDVVKSKIEGLGGRVDIESEVGKGSKFTMYLPLTLAIIQALMVKVEEEEYALPLASIEETTLVNSSDIDKVHGQDVLRLRESLIPIVDMRKVLKLNGLDKSFEEEKFAIIVSKGEKKAGLIVDELIGQQEVVIKSLGAYLGDIKGFTGATILGDGKVALILDVNSMIFK